MRILKYTTTLLAVLLAFSCTSTRDEVTLNNPLSLTPVAVKGEHIYPITTSQLEGWLVTSEASGLYWLDSKAEQVKHWPGHLAVADWRLGTNSNSEIVVAAIDSNTSALQLLSLNVKTAALKKRLTIESEIADLETLCLSKDGNQLYVYTVDARGLLTHYLLTTTHSSEQLWQLAPIRELMVGPNISACSVADTAKTLFIAEEDIGVWQYPSEPEAENTRELESFAEQPELESVAALSNGGWYAVASDQTRIYQRGQQSNTFPVALDSALKSVHVGKVSNTLYLGLFDEHSEQLLVGTLELPVATTAKPAEQYSITAVAETLPVKRFGDAADDPAIWVNDNLPQHSLVLGTDKKYGLNVYTLNGALNQTLPVGKINNIDLRQNITTPSGNRDIAVASNRSFQSLSVFDITRSGKVEHLAELPTTLKDIYGLCTGKVNGEFHVFANDTSGLYHQYRITFDSRQPEAELIKEFRLPSQPEGCVVDDESGELYMGEEARGIWLTNVNQTFVEPTLIATVNNAVHADVEGMGIYRLNDRRYLIVSSQGNNQFAVYALEDNNRLLGTFGVVLNYKDGIDGVSETDGLEVTSVALGEKFPMGAMIVQDGRNVFPLQPQNFKIINGNQLAEFIETRESASVVNEVR